MVGLVVVNSSDMYFSDWGLWMVIKAYSIKIRSQEKQ